MSIETTQFSSTSSMCRYTCTSVECHGFQSHQRQLIFLRESDCLGCTLLLCVVVCLTLLASFFLPSHLSLKHVHVHQSRWSDSHLEWVWPATLSFSSVQCVCVCVCMHTCTVYMYVYMYNVYTCVLKPSTRVVT